MSISPAGTIHQLDPLPKKRLFSRVLSTPLDILGRSKSMSGIRSTPAEPSIFRRISQRAARIPSITTPSEGQLERSVSELSIDSQNLQDTIAAFPLPPNGRPHRRLSLAGAMSKAPRHVLPVREPPVLAAHLKIMPEMEALDTEAGQSLWVAVEISGVIPAPAPEQSSNPAAPISCLDWVILVDTSPYTSPAALQNCRDLAAMVAANLIPGDRLAIITFSPKITHILPLHFATVGSVTKAMETVRIFRDDKVRLPAASDLENALWIARDTLAMAEGRDNHSHILLFSSHIPSGNSMLWDQGEALCLHIIHPAVFPWKDCQGQFKEWPICSTFTPKSHPVDSTPEEQDPLRNVLKSILNNARKCIGSGRLENVQVTVEPGKNVRIMAILGSASIPYLVPGQIMSFLVKMKVGAYELPANGGRSSSKDLFKHINAMLGEASTSLLSVEVKYQHSLLPADTHLTIKAFGKVKRHTPHSRWSDTHSDRNRGRFALRGEVQKLIGFYLATHHSPRQGLLALQDLFGEDACLSFCPAYIQALVTELKYQARITDHFGLDPPLSSFMASTPSPQASSSLVPTPEISTSNSISPPRPPRPMRPDALVIRRLESALGKLPLTSLTNSPSPLAPSPSTQTIIVRKRAAGIGLAAITGYPFPNASPQPTKALASTDEAHRIWIRMRQASRTPHISAPVPSNEQLRKMAEHALKNKRSLGADTLKSMAGQVESRGVSNGSTNGQGIVPWL
ncbi:MAG: hypothetical protein M1829_003950 [Trizodia sp. TS-e1964]|nr:MAG: hypothetical protein M1829_003950 [Trizodia sp. TS-e1964]